MDIVFIHIFRSLLASVGIDEDFDIKIQTDIVFTELADILKMGLVQYDSCWKFEDSDMFCLNEEEKDLYFVYTLNDDGASSVDREDDYLTQI